jgi:hypothetical protein
MSRSYHFVQGATIHSRYRPVWLSPPWSHNYHSSAIPSVMMVVSPQVGHLPVPSQFGHFSSVEFSVTFLPVPKHRWQSPDPSQSLHCLRTPPRLPNRIDRPQIRLYGGSCDVVFAGSFTIIGSGVSVGISVISWTCSKWFPLLFSWL